MCDATSLFMLSQGTQLVGSVQQAKAQREAGQAQKQYYDFLASNSETQAGMVLDSAQKEANFTQDQAARDAKQVQNAGKQVTAAQTAGMAGNGIVGGATAEDVIKDSFDKAKLDELTVRYNADLKNWENKNASEFQAWDLKNQAAGYRRAGQNAVTAGGINSAATLLGGAASVGGGLASWYKKPAYYQASKSGR